MSFLEELDKSVRALIEKNRTLESELVEVTTSFKALKSTCESLETALFAKTTTVEKLLEEKESIKLEVDELLGCLKELAEKQL